MSTVPNAKITYLPMDLASFSSVKNAAAIFISQSHRLEILLNNAGIMACPWSETAEGYEIQFGTNHMGHALLTKLLLPTMLQTAEEPGADVRIVTLSSYGHTMAPSAGIIFDTAALAKEGPWVRYGQSKLANILFTKQLAKRYPSIKSVAIHPGNIETDLWDHNVKLNLFVKYLVNLFGSFWLQNVAEGARNQLWAAVAKGVISGTYYTPVGQPSKGTSNARSEKLAEKLWNWTEKEIKKHTY